MSFSARLVRWGQLYVIGLILLLAACSGLAPSPWRDVITAVNAGPHPAELALLASATGPLLAVKSPDGIGRADVQLSQPLTLDFTITFPGLKQLEYVALKQGDDEFHCEGGSEDRIACTWSRDWPVGSLLRTPDGMTVAIPARVFATPGEWSLYWVDYWRE